MHTRIAQALEEKIVRHKLSPPIKQHRVELVAFVLPEAYLEGIEQLVDHGRFKSRSEAVRFAVEELIHGELWRTKVEKSVYEMPICERA